MTKRVALKAGAWYGPTKKAGGFGGGTSVGGNKEIVAALIKKKGISQERDDPGHQATKVKDYRNKT